jgi:DNA polymerase epsilon subunit 1
METAGMVTHVGASIITDARILVEQLGKPLELDTDGIWCLLPQNFPENYFLTTSTGKKLFMSYPCTMLNLLTYDKFKNP